MHVEILAGKGVDLWSREPSKISLKIKGAMVKSKEDALISKAEARLIRAGFTDQNISALYSLPLKVAKNIKLSMFCSVGPEPQLLVGYGAC